MKKPPASSSPSTLKRWTHQLGYLAQLMSSGMASGAEADRFYGLVDRILELPSDVETRVVGETIDTLAQIGDEQGAKWLVEELEIEAQLQHQPDPAGRERACLLFALPVVVPSGASLQQHCSDLELFGELHDILQEADVVNSGADFGLVPRVFSYLELFSKSYGELKRLTTYLGNQVLSGHQTLVLPDTFEGEQAPAGASVSPYVDLYFLVGVVCCRNSELDEVFPPLGDETTPANSMAFDDDGNGVLVEPGDPGQLDSGAPWEGPFCQAFEDAFGVIPEALTVLPPDGLPEDLRRGLELSREIGLLQMMETCVPANAPGLVRLSPLREVQGEWFVEVTCLASDPESGRADGQELRELETCRWQVLNHETEAESIEKLVEGLSDARIACETPLSNTLNPLSSLILH